MNTKEKTHYRKAFNSPYLSSKDLVGPTQLTIANVRLERDHTKRSDEIFNTAYFTAKELRPGEKLKPMILNAGNSEIMKALAGSPYLEHWSDISITVWVNPDVKWGRDTVEGLRIGKGDPAITDQQAAQLNKQIKTLGIDIQKFLAFLGANSIKDLPASKLKPAISALDRKAKQKAA